MKKHSHTLKPGRHFFPFQLQLGGSLPSSIFTNTSGGASVAYKLRAHVVRSGLSHNLQALTPVTIVRSFAAEALEYQQTLEIENTWPEKLMYSIMVPHKAWAAGDVLTALVKFSPLVKGVGVLSITTTIQETTKIFARSGAQELARTVASIRHEIIGGKAVEAQEYDHPQRHKTPLTPGFSVPSTPNLASSSRGGMSYFPSTSRPSSLPHSLAGSSEALSAAGSSLSHAPQSYFPPAPPQSNPEDNLEMSQDDIVTYITFPIPLSVTPTHGLDPIVVSHRIRWSILILNLDGHTSELRCSLPLHLLDHRLLEEARSFTAATRRLLLGGPDVPPEPMDDDMELPSYNAHVRDRVANMYLPESATMRVTNPWVQGGISPVVNNAAQDAFTSPWPRTSSGASSPLEAHALSHLPHAPGSGDTPLDWVNSELLLSLSELEPPALSLPSRSRPHPPSHTPSDDTDSGPSTRPGSGGASRRSSRANSRANSPERGARSPKVLHVAGPNETYVHSGHASRNLHGLFKATMKPFTSLAHPHWLPSRSNSHANLAEIQQRAHLQHLQLQQIQQQQQSLQTSRPLNLSDPNSGTALLHRAFTEVPDYRMASRGFIGGVPPLSSMQGLPSYAEVERSQSDSNLVDMLRRADISTDSSPANSTTDVASAPGSPLMMSTSSLSRLSR